MKEPRDILKRVLAQKVDQAEVFLTSDQILTIDVLDGKVESIKEITDRGCAIRVIKNQKLGFAFTTDFEDFMIDEAIKQAVANAENSEADEFHSFPAPAKTIPKLDLIDPIIGKTSIKDKVELALQIEGAAYEYDKAVKKTEKVQYSDVLSEAWLVNSHGLSANYKTNHCGAFAEIIAGKNQEMEAGFGHKFVKNFADLSPEEIGAEAARKACAMLGAGTISSQKIPLVFDPEVGAEILDALVSSLSAEAVQKGKSMLAGKIAQFVAAPLISIIDDGLLPNGLGTAPFDGEGTPSQKTILVEQGKLNSYLYNFYSARKDKTKSTGNAARASFKGPVVIGPTNLYFQAGTSLPADMISSIKHGLYVTKVMGMHTVNPISGNFSVGAAGILIQNGRKTTPIRGITISGNLLEMLKQVAAIGQDLKFFSTTGSPTILIKDMTVSGT